MNDITYCIPFLNNVEGIKTAVDSVLYRSSIVPRRIIIIDNSTKGLAALALADKIQKHTNIFVLPQTENLGVSKSWNYFMREYQDDIIIANDDVFVDYDTIKGITTAALYTPDEIFFAGPSESGNAFSFFLLKKRGFEEIGPFDENFYPAYFEDNDYAYRMKLRGYSIQTVADATYSHAGSQTLKNYTADQLNKHHIQFRKNQTYYIKKWGGLPHAETFEQPFDGKDS